MSDVKVSLSGKPADGKSMTLAELGEFLAQCQRQGLPGDIVPKVRVNFGGGVKSIEAEGAQLEVHSCPEHPDILLAGDTPCPKPHKAL